MKFLCLVWVDEAALDAQTPSEHATLVNESLDYDDELRRGGHFLAAQALQRARAATTVRIRKGQAHFTDGPFAETKEQLGGFILIDARDAGEALALASKIPVARFGAIEVRPIDELVRQRV